MHKGLKIAFVVGCVCFGVGGLLTMGTHIFFDHEDAIEIENQEYFEYTNKEAIHTLKINSDVCDIQVLYGDDFIIKTRGLPKMGEESKSFDVSFSQADGTYTFEEKYKKKNVNFKNKPKILVQVPAEIKNLDLELNVGDVEVQNLVLKTLHVRNDVGEIEIDCCEAEEVRCENDLGDIEYEGDFLKTMNVEANVGDVEIFLARPIEEYSYDIDCKVGK